MLDAIDESQRLDCYVQGLCQKLKRYGMHTAVLAIICSQPSPYKAHSPAGTLLQQHADLTIHIGVCKLSISMH